MIGLYQLCYKIGFTPLFHPITTKTKTNCNSLTIIFPHLASALSSDWFTVWSKFFVIGWSDYPYFGFRFTTLN